MVAHASRPTDTAPCASRNAARRRSPRAGSARRQDRRRGSRGRRCDRPSARLAATEPTPAIAMTPSTMQAMKTPKPRSPPRSSRQAKRSGSALRRSLPFAAATLIAATGEARRRVDPSRTQVAARGRSGAASAVSWVTSTSVRAALAMAAEQQLDDLARRSLRRDCRSARRRPGSPDWAPARGRSPRAAARRRRVRPDSDASRAAKPTAASSCAARAKASRCAGKFERHRDVFQRRHGRDQVEGLEDDADLAAAEARERVLVELAAGPRRRRRPSRCRAAPGRPSPSAASICPSPTARPGRRPRRGLYSGRCP